MNENKALPVLYRVNKESLQVCQKEMTKLEDEVYREAEENALLKEALGRTQLQLNQEKRLNRAIKLHKVRVSGPNIMEVVLWTASSSGS